MVENFNTLKSKHAIKFLMIVCFVFLSYSCTNSSANKGESNHLQSNFESQNNVEIQSNINDESKDFSTIGEIPLPEGYQRISDSGLPFLSYLRKVGINHEDEIVHLYNGKEKNNQDAHFAILDIDVGEKDLQQCADAVMRLRAEYLYKEKRFDEISFLFTNGDRVYFKQYAEGFRPTIKGNHVVWSKKAEQDYSYASFRKYMNLIFMYAGTLSLSKELESVSNFENIIPGDVIIIGGSPGHAVIVVDMAKHQTTGDKIFMIAQSYMPAQEIHILKNYNSKNLSPWYEIPSSQEFNTPEYYFTTDNLMRFSTP